MMASTTPKKVFVLGGDGFCGWPTALHLADKGTLLTSSSISSSISSSSSRS
jgi:nucleoside-diphosphate-sugar epimerase